MEQIEMRDGETERVQRKTILIIGRLLLLTVVHAIDRVELGLQIHKATEADLKTQVHSLQAAVAVVSNNENIVLLSTTIFVPH